MASEGTRGREKRVGGKRQTRSNRRKRNMETETGDKKRKGAEEAAPAIKQILREAVLNLEQRGTLGEAAIADVEGVGSSICGDRCENK